ncbi:class I SAM-dependent methyltransferase [Marinifilum flexuosum]|uniref:class I SAM-dependent methyltransferase n=1 Tax=Marinifilum flexuosum TaxID=1117708 RepID=UPI00248F5016|nr:class I SAM-dependent methyltransferase [Marinifilum flexuosum]
MKNPAFTRNAHLFYKLLSKKRVNPERINNLIDLFNDYRIKSIIDIGCGGGDVTEYLSNNGFNVTGLDNSHQMINIAKQQHENSKVNWCCEDVMRYKSQENFDCATALYSFIQTLPTQNMINNILSVVENNVNPNFSFIEIQNAEVIKKNYPFNKQNSWLDDTYKIEAVSKPINRSCYSLEFTISDIISKNVIAVLKHKIFYFDINKLTSLIKRNGFIIENIVDSKDFKSSFQSNISSGIGCLIRMKK